MSQESKVTRAMKKGRVDEVAKLLGEHPRDVYTYGMQPEWKKRAYQWVADWRRPAAIYPIHCWSAGYGGPQSPMTWFSCRTCGSTMLGSPHEVPSRGCMRCLIGGREFAGWEVADKSEAFTSTLKATKDMPGHAIDDVLLGPRV